MSPYDTDEIPDIPTDLADAVRHAAAAVPAGQHSLSQVHRRRRLHQRRRTAAVAGVAAVAVAAGAVGVPTLVRLSGTDAEPLATASASANATAGPAQRLIIGTSALLGILEGPRANAGITSPAGILEVDAAGKVVAHPFADVDSTAAVVTLPDGRLVVLNPRFLKPGVGPWNTDADMADFEYRLVLGRYDTNVRVVGEQLQLLGATAEGA